jgi:class 3 adenylate cyclase
MDVRLTIRAPGEPPADYTLAGEPVVLGRDPSCEIQIPSQYVSRRHARIEPNGSDLLIVDLGGRNPVLLNGAPVAGSARLVPGDTVTIADVTIDIGGGEGVSTGTIVFDPRNVTAPMPQPQQPATRSAGIQSVWLGQSLGPGGTLTIMFTDLELSTNMVTELGERDAYRIIGVHNTILREQFREFRGHEAKRLGDGFLVLFASARDGMNCAISIQRRLDEVRTDSGEPIRVRIGLHIGEVLWDENDIFGSAVNFAARVSAEAQGGEVLISALLREVMAVSGEFHFAEQREVPLKGFKGVHQLTPLEWKAEPSAGTLS